jgi:hypothetical protein
MANPELRSLIAAGALFLGYGARLRDAVKTCYTSARKISACFQEPAPIRRDQFSLIRAREFALYIEPQ